MLAKNQKLSFIIVLHSLELLEPYPHPCYFELIFNSKSQISSLIPSPSTQNPLQISLIDSQFQFPVPPNSPENPLSIQIKLRESFSKKKLAFNQLDLKLLNLPYQEWIPLSNKSGLKARLLVNIVYSSFLDIDTEEIKEKTPSNKALAFGRGTSWIDSKSKETSLDRYRKKAYFFGDDANPIIFSFDFTTESLEFMETPDNLQLMGYSMACGLPNGKILICGGINHKLNIIVPSVFYYDPLRGKARVLSSMIQARYTHNLTYKDHYVYAIGGRYYGKGALGVLNKCERYDLNNNTWTSIAPLNNKRCTSTCYIFENSIYVVGGYQGDKRLDSVEKYDEKTNVWSLCSFKLITPSEAGSGLMISDNEGLYIGGQNEVEKSLGILLIDFKEETCVDIGKVNKIRLLSHVAFDKEKKKLHIFGGAENDWETLDTQSWKSTISGTYQNIVKKDLKNFASCVTSDYFQENLSLYEEKILIFGSNDYIYHLDRKNSILEKTPIPQTMKLLSQFDTCLMPNGLVLISGGVNALGYADKKAYLYNPYNNTALIGASMLNGKWSHSLIYHQGFIYSIGGYSKSNQSVSFCERYNLKMNKWEEIEGLIESRASPLLILYENSLFCFGGTTGKSPVLSIEKYEFQEDSWKLLEVQIPFSASFIPSYKINSSLFLYDFKASQAFVYDFNESTFCKKTYPSKIFPETLFNMININKEILTIESKPTEIQIQIIPISPDLISNKKFSFPIEKPIENAIKISPILTNPCIFPFFEEISLYQDIERESRLIIFSNSSEHHILEFHMKTEHFELTELQPQDKPITFFKHSKALGLPDGKILLTGGLYFSELGISVVNNSFLYNPFKRALKPIAPMNTCRFKHAIIGGSKFVYCIGGKKLYSSGVLKACERYNIRKDIWEEMPQLIEGVYNVNGCNIERNLYVFGGNTGAGLSRTIQVLDKIKLVWSKFDLLLPKPIENIGALALNYHEIILCGGHLADCSVNEAFLLDIAANKLIELPSMLHNRNNPKIAAFGKNIYVLGGNSAFSCEKAWVTDPRKHFKWEIFSSYNHLISNDLVEMCSGMSRMDLEALKADNYSENIEGNTLNSVQLTFDKLYIFGTESFPYILRLKLPSLVWEKISKPEVLQMWDYAIALTLPNGNIFITGGISSTLTSIKNNVYSVTISGDTIQAIERPHLIHSRYTHTMCYLNNYVYAMGGRFFGAGVDGVLNHCERFNLLTKEWAVIANLNMKSCTAVSCAYMNKVYIFGGYRGDGRNKHIERYNELTNIWENVPLLLNNPIEAGVLISLSRHEFVMLGGKDDFTEQKYVMVYDLERGSIRKEKEMINARILCKCAKFNKVIYVVGGNADKTCEMAQVGEWDWKEFDGYEKFIEGLEKPNLVKNCYAQSL